jgi:RIO kinase 2
MKLHRLGRTSFRAVKAKRDYLCHRKAASWIYFSRLAAVREFGFMCALHERGYPVPRPLGHSRHVIVMELVDGILLNQVSELGNAVAVAGAILGVLTRLATDGLVHCDLNEFNIMIGDDERITVIDFPQMVSIRHPQAKELFERDVDGVRRFFEHRFGVSPDDLPDVSFEEAMQASEHVSDRIDMLLAASGFGSRRADHGPQLADTGVDDLDEHIEDLRKDLQDVDAGALALPSGLAAADADDGVEESDATSGDDSEEGVDGTGGTCPDDFQSLGRAAVSERSAAAEEREINDAVGAVALRTDAHDSSASRNAPGSKPHLDQSAIAERVRRQRKNQLGRQQVARRNLVKDSEKRKSKAEKAESSFWG